MKKILASKSYTRSEKSGQTFAVLIHLRKRSWKIDFNDLHSRKNKIKSCIIRKTVPCEEFLHLLIFNQVFQTRTSLSNVYLPLGSQRLKFIKSINLSIFENQNLFTVSNGVQTVCYSNDSEVLQFIAHYFPDGLFRFWIHMGSRFV